MLNRLQKAILKAYGKAQISLISHAVVACGCDDDPDYLVLSCVNLFHENMSRSENYHIIDWQHPHTRPCWEEYCISEQDYSTYMRKRFSVLFHANRK